MSDDDRLNELRGDYLTQLRHVNSMADELEVEQDKLLRLEAALIAEQNRQQSPLQNHIGSLSATSTEGQS